MNRTASRSPWAWIPSLYFIEGVPYLMVMTVSTILFKRMGLSNADLALYTSWLYLPWVIKFAWSPLVEIIGTRRGWITSMQVLIGGGLAGVAWALPGSDFLRLSLAFFWLLAFASATHDIAADGFYLLALREEQQSFFVGIRSTFYRIAMIFGQGGIVILAGWLEKTYPTGLAWSYTFAFVALLMLAAGLYHQFVLPHPATDQQEARSVNQMAADFAHIFVAYFRRPGIVWAILFLLFYRIGESQLVKIASPFLLDPRDKGGLGLATEQVGLLYGTLGIGALMAGGILGGIAISRYGLKKCLWGMIAAINIPNALYIYLSVAQPTNLWLIGSCVVVESLGYGFGFTAFLLYLMYLSEGPYKAAHYAIGTSFMALGMMIPGMFSGKVQEWLGYPGFFTWATVVCLIPALIALKVRFDADFGKKKQESA
ncbi:MAG: MFS transporter [Bacteroidetes bacterium]|nr:MAG: MFS transporter [Bacteroidota bacterium]